MAEKDRVVCEECGMEMNHHCDKMDRAAIYSEPDAADRELGGVLEETYTCPGCGKSHTRCVAR